jgi:putative hydrolase of the HAD superfamily
MPDKPHLEALLLDLGNVFAFHDNVLLFERLARAFGTTPALFKARLDGGLWDSVNRGQLPGDALRQQLVERLGHFVSEPDFTALWSSHFRIHDEMVRAVEPLVGRVKLVLLSNTHDLHVASLRPRLPILERFDALVLSCEVGAVKPEAAIYERALEAAGCAPAAAAFFDDVPAYAQAASALGIHGRLYTTADDFLAQLSAFTL